MPSYAKFYKPLMTARIPDGAKIVFCALLDFQQLGVNPKIETLAKATGRCSRAVDNALAKLRKIGVLQIQWGQRQSRYVIAENWEILLRKMCVSEPISDTQDVRNEKRKMCVSEPAGPYYSSDSFLKTNTVAAAFVSRTRESASANGHPAAAAAVVLPSKKKTRAKPSELCLELLSKHPHPQQPEKAEVELQRALQSASADLIRERHAQWVQYWDAHPKKWSPHLWRWFAEGDWLVAPKKPPADGLKAAFERDRQKAKGAS